MVLLIRWIRKDKPFSWGVEAINVFQSLKSSFMTTPFLIHVDPSKVLETCASDFAIGAIFSQFEKDNLCHPIGFYSWKFFLVKLITRFLIKNF